MKEIIFKPEQQRVLVLPDEKDQQTTDSGIILPANTQEGKPYYGTIICVGDGEEDRPMRYKPGQRILFSSFAGIEVPMNIKNHGYREYKVMNQIDIMGVIIEL